MSRYMSGTNLHAHDQSRTLQAFIDDVAKWRFVLSDGCYYNVVTNTTASARCSGTIEFGIVLHLTSVIETDTTNRRFFLSVSSPKRERIH
jgi:hypothetical protein